MLNATIVIPSLEPNEKLVHYIDELNQHGLHNIIVVDDGSGEAYASIFDEVKAKGAVVLAHAQNKGKGAALKTAFKHIKTNAPCNIVVTADSDGQHTVPDVLSVINATEQHANALVLGSRNFDLPHVPFKSRKGNKITSRVYQLFYGQYVSDTQTGLRGFNSKFLDDMLAVEGERFEYEMNMLIYFSKRKWPMVPVEIETVYENNNEGTHFHPIKDSFKIYRVMFPNVFKFLSSSVLTTLLDYVCFVLLYFIFNALGLYKPFTFYGHFVLSIVLASVVARIVSSLCNFYINQSFVFKTEGQSKVAMAKYFLLAVAIIVLSSSFTSMLVDFHMLSAPIAKPLVDTILFVLSYLAQKHWVFKKDKE